MGKLVLGLIGKVLHSVQASVLSCLSVCYSRPVAFTLPYPTGRFVCTLPEP
jgi:hypothetical protein